MTPSFCSLTDTKQSLQYTIKTHLSGPPMPKFEANMNYILPSPPSSTKQCNKSATVKFHMELLLNYYDREAISQWRDTIIAPIECYSGYEYFQLKKRKSIPMIDSLIQFNTLLLIKYLSAIDTLTCHREIEFNMVYFLRIRTKCIT